jgi:hypothetical protein
MSVVSESALGRSSASAAEPRAGQGSARQLRVTAVLSAIFNVMALNGVLVIACLPIVTAPAALRAAMVALERWRAEGEDRVVRQFMLAMRAPGFWRTTLTVAVPLVAVALAAEELIYFSRAATAGNAVGIGLGFAGLLLALAGSGYVLVLAARQPDLSPTDTWFVAVSLVARNPRVARPLLAGELVAGLLVLTRDPSLAVVGIPVGLLALVRHTALAPVRRVCELIEDGAGNPEDREVER